MVACQPVHSDQACLYCNHCRSFNIPRYRTHLHCLLVVARDACPVPCVCLAFTSRLPSTCSNPQSPHGWSWQVLTWIAAATYTTCLISSRSKEKKRVFSSSLLGELALSAVCSQGLHSLLHTAAFHATSIHVCKSSNPMLSGTWHSTRLWGWTLTALSGSAASQIVPALPHQQWWVPHPAALLLWSYVPST